MILKGRKSASSNLVELAVLQLFVVGDGELVLHLEVLKAWWSCVQVVGLARGGRLRSNYPDIKAPIHLT